jgi:hypothetical protein
LGTSQFADWVTGFEAAAEQRRADGDPDWARGAALDAVIVRSLQRFQLGESGDGAGLAAKASFGGDESYAKAVRLFIAEEQEHARLLAALLTAANARVISSHWSDAVFTRLRRALGLHLELMVLFVAEFVALSYYRACRDGTGDPLATEVARRILADEERHVRFHSQRLGLAVAGLPTVAWLALSWAWQLLMIGTACAVVVDHGAALRRLGVPRRQFVVHLLGGFRSTVTSIRRGESSPAPEPASQPPRAGHPAPQNATLWLLDKTVSRGPTPTQVGGYFAGHVCACPPGCDCGKSGQRQVHPAVRASLRKVCTRSGQAHWPAVPPGVIRRLRPA